MSSDSSVSKSEDGKEPRRRGSTLLVGVIVVVATSAIVWALSTARQRSHNTGDSTDDEETGSVANLERTVQAARKRHAQAEESLKQLAKKANDERTSFSDLAGEVEAFRAKYGGTPAAIRAAGLLTDRPSTLDAFDPTQIPEAIRNQWRKAGFDAKDVVAVLGQHALGKQSLNTVALSADDALLLTADSSDTARLSDCLTGKEQSVFRGNQAWFVPDLSSGKPRVLTRASDDILRLFTSDGKMQAELGTGGAIAVSLDGSQVLIGSKNGMLSVVELESGSELYRWPSQDREVNVVAILPDGQRVISAGADGVLRVWQLRGQRLVKDIHGNWKQITKLVASPDGRRAFLATSKNDAARLIGLETNWPVRYWETGATITALALSADGRYAALALRDGKGDCRVHVYDVGSENRLRNWLLPGVVHDLAFSHDGRHLVTANADGTAYILRL